MRDGARRKPPAPLTPCLPSGVHYLSCGNYTYLAGISPSGSSRGGEEPVIQFREDRVHVLQGLQLRGVDVPVLQGVQQLVEAVEVVVKAAPGVFFGGAVGDDEGPVGALSEHQLAARLAEGPLLQA